MDMLSRIKTALNEVPVTTIVVHPTSPYKGSLPKTDIKKGSKGEDVKHLQNFLNWYLKAGLKKDGICGAKTVSAIKKFQKKHKLKVDGWFGPKCRAKAKSVVKRYSTDTKTTTSTKTATAEKKAYTGTLPTTKLVKTNAQVIADTVRWAKWIANDNDFHYGYTNKSKGANAHHNGCYFCGTQKLKKNMLMPEHTYCCNPFIGAAWAHGGCVPEALKLCQHTSSWGFSKSEGYNKSDLFRNLGHPAKSKLKPGDVLCKDTHVAMYVGNGKLVEASGGDDNKKNSNRWNNSIAVKTLTDSRYKGFPRVHRFKGSVNTTMAIRHGEVSLRVAQWQAFLNWWFDLNLKTDGCFGDETLKWTKKFQKEQLGKGQDNGVIGSKTLEAAKKCKK